jgi:hypothetical protein
MQAIMQQNLPPPVMEALYATCGHVEQWNVQKIPDVRFAREGRGLQIFLDKRNRVLIRVEPFMQWDLGRTLSGSVRRFVYQSGQPLHRVVLPEIQTIVPHPTQEERAIFKQYRNECVQIRCLAALQQLRHFNRAAQAIAEQPERRLDLAAEGLAILRNHDPETIAAPYIRDCEKSAMIDLFFGIDLYTETT